MQRGFVVMLGIWRGFIEVCGVWCGCMFMHDYIVGLM